MGVTVKGDQQLLWVCRVRFEWKIWLFPASISIDKLFYVSAARAAACMADEKAPASDCPFRPKSFAQTGKHICFNYEAFYKEALYKKHHDKSYRYHTLACWKVLHCSYRKSERSSPQCANDYLGWTIIQSCLKLYSVFYANASSCIDLGFDFAVVLLVMERVIPYCW